MKAGRTWAALDVEYLTRDLEIVGLRKEVGKALVAMWWPRLITACKDGDDLTAVVDIEAMADELGDERPVDDVVVMLQRFVDRALLSVASGCMGDGVVALRLVAGPEWQVVAGTRRSRKSRAKTADENTDAPNTQPRKRATKPKSAAAATLATPVQRIATPRNKTQPSRARTDSDSDTETENSLVSEARATRPPVHRSRALDPGVEQMVEKLLRLLPGAGTDSRGNFFDLAMHGATEADLGDAIGAITEVEDIHNRAGYAYRTLRNRLASRNLISPESAPTA